jgi:large subunit ribosomal protein L25
MKTHEIIGFKRANLGKTEAKRLRQESNVPCVLYGGEKAVHFHTPMFLFKDLVYTGDVHKVKLTIEGSAPVECILKDIQFHPVNEIILHADFLQLKNDREIKMDIPVAFVGQAPGVLKGGKLIQKLKKISVKALPQNLPDYIEVDVANLDLNKSVKVGDIKADKFVILNPKSIPVASVEVPRALKVAEDAAAAGGKDAKKEEKK